MTTPFSLDIGTTTVHGRAWGEGETNIVLVHGLGGSSIEWESAGPTLADATAARVTAPDLPGFGRTAVGQHSAAVPGQRKAVVALLEDLGPAVVVGNSMGGLVALGVAAERPDLVERLVLVAPALPTRTSAAAVLGAARFVVAMAPGIGPRMRELRQRRLGAGPHVDERLKVIVHRPERVDPGVRTLMVELAEHRIPRRQTHAAYAVAARSIFTGARSGRRFVSQVSAPTLVVHGRHDLLVPVALVDQLRDARSDWTYEVFDDAGHLPHLEQPAEFVTAVGGWIRARVGA